MTAPDKDPTAMEPTTTSSTPALTPEVFFAERQKFWFAWSNFVTFAVIGIAVLLILLAYFLL